MSTIGKIIITKELSDSIDILHNIIKNKEWSGVLFYNLKSGKISDLKDLVFEAKYVYPMDIGTAATTEFDYSGELMNVFEIYPEAFECNTSLIHSHHNMQAFHSQTDMKELEDNSGLYNYYISLVVNFAKTPVCKIGFPTENKVECTMLDENGQKFTISKLVKGVEIFDLTVEYETSSEKPWLNDRIKELEKKNIPTVTQEFRGFPTFGEPPLPILKSKTSPLFQINKAEQFLINLCNVSIHGVNLKDCLTNLSFINDPEDIEMFLDEMEREFEPTYLSTYETQTISNTDMVEALGILMKYEKEFAGNESYEAIKNQIILYL